MEDFQYEETEEGSGQGSVCSPVIANIYMHYVIVWWFKDKMQPNLQVQICQRKKETQRGRETRYVSVKTLALTKI